MKENVCTQIQLRSCVLTMHETPILYSKGECSKLMDF